MKTLLIAINVLLLCAILGVALYWNPEPEMLPLPGTYAERLGRDVPLAPPPSGGDFTLEGSKGPVALSDFRGRLVLLYFGYTYCPDICPTSLLTWAQALAELSPAERALVQPLFVSVDPERDDIARLAEYVQFFHPSIIGLTGPLPRLQEIAGRYGSVFVRQDNASAGGYVIDHTATTHVIDGAGRLVASIPHGSSAAQLVKEIRNHLPPH